MSRESKRATEFPNTALRNPILALVLLLLFLWRISLLDYLTRSRALAAFGNILDCGLMLLVLLLDGLWLGSSLDESSWWSAALIVTFGAAVDSEGLGVGELDVDVLLGDAWEFTVKFVVCLVLLEVEFGLEGGERATTTSSRWGVVVVELIKKTEERGEGGLGSVV